MTDVPPNAQRGAVPPSSPGTTSGSAGERPTRRFSAGQLLGGLLFVITLVFVFENLRSVKVRLLGPEVSAPLALPIVIAAALGAAVAWLLRYRRHRRRPR